MISHPLLALPVFTGAAVDGTGPAVDLIGGDGTGSALDAIGGDGTTDEGLGSVLFPAGSVPQPAVSTTAVSTTTAVAERARH
ncbi:hypothetical protein [Paractinoplanes maris]|uniref:hypothetical protein n=1 Tax=Paractinoplanes maris TaxID=1734446 RepID=UPI002021C3CC|nr:hypothetical protein [Actinoplanes maris]